MRTGRQRTIAFTLIEVLVSVAMIALLIAILLPSLGAARRRAQAAVCLSQVHAFGQGLHIYTAQNRDALLPSRMPDLGDGINWRIQIKGGLKYRPSFLSMLASSIGVPPFAQPLGTRDAVDAAGQRGSQQNYASALLLCPSVPNWTDERNGAYGYNYQFLGNSRLRSSGGAVNFRNWPVRSARIRSPARCVAIADSMGTAASFATRGEYLDNSRDADRLGNEGFNLDPPRVDAASGEMADFEGGRRTGVHPRHTGRCIVLWMDLHAGTSSPAQLGYQVFDDGVFGLEGRNFLFNPSGRDEAWTDAH